MKPEDRYLTFVRWSNADKLYVGYCPDLFPAGGVCHGSSSVEAFQKLAEIVEDTVTTADQQGIPLPEPSARVTPKSTSRRRPKDQPLGVRAWDRRAPARREPKPSRRTLNLPPIFYWKGFAVRRGCSDSMNAKAPIESFIVEVRGLKVILAADLAALYGVETKRLNEQVRRNADRFPNDFCFLLTTPEKEDLEKSGQIPLTAARL